MMLSFFTLAITGMALKFSYAGWAQGLSRAFGGFEAMTAMLMFGWSTAVLASIVQKLQSADDN